MILTVRVSTLNTYHGSTAIINMFTLTVRGSMSESDVYRRHILTSKVNPRAVMIIVQNKRYVFITLNPVFSVLGCPDIIPPENTWFRRDDAGAEEVTSRAKMGCTYTEFEWHLDCEGQEWVGPMGNCSKRQYLQIFKQFVINFKFMITIWGNLSFHNLSPLTAGPDDGFFQFLLAH